MTKPLTVSCIKGFQSYEEAEAHRNKFLHKDLYGLYSIYVDEQNHLWAPMPVKVLKAMMDFREEEEKP